MGIKTIRVNVIEKVDGLRKIINNMKIYQPLKNNWSISEDQGFIKDQIQDRVNSESNLCWALGYPNVRQEEITGRLGEPLEEVL